MAYPDPQNLSEDNFTGNNFSGNALSDKEMERRARLFLPFDALEGFADAIQKEAEKLLISPPPLLAPDHAEEIDRCLHSLRPGEFLHLIIHRNGHILTLDGRLTAICPDKRQLILQTSAVSDTLTSTQKESTDEAAVKVTFDELIEIRKLF